MNMVTPSELTPSVLTGLLRGIGITPPHASLLVNRHRRPSLELAARIERKLGISCLYWVPYDAAQEAEIDAALGVEKSPDTPDAVQHNTPANGAPQDESKKGVRNAETPQTGEVRA